MHKKVCVRCRTENEEHYRFCKNCGASLPVVDQFKSSEYVYPKEENKPSKFDPTALDYDLVSGEELASYVGENSERIMPKFFSMQLLGKKTSWCFPVFIFGVLFGFFGMSFWFFARKMFKVGLLFAALGVCFVFADVAINYDADRAFAKGYTEIVSSTIDVIRDPYSVDVEAKAEEIAAKSEQIISSYSQDYNPVFSGISNYIGGMFLPIFMGFFALNIYKNKAIKDIKRAKEKYGQDEFTLARISALGGRKGYLVLIPIALMLLCGILSTVILFI